MNDTLNQELGHAFSWRSNTRTCFWI